MAFWDSWFGNNDGPAPGAPAPSPSAPPPTSYGKSPISPELKKAYEAFVSTGYQGANKLFNLGHKDNWVDYWSGGTPTVKGNPDQTPYDITTGENLSGLIQAYNDWSARTGAYASTVGKARAGKAAMPGRDQTILGVTPDQSTRSLLGGGIRPDAGTVKGSLLGGGY